MLGPNGGDGISAGHDGKHRVLLYQQPAIEVESVPFEMILMKAVSNNRLLIFGYVGGRDRFLLNRDRNWLNARESDGENQNAGKDQKDIFVAAQFHLIQK
jgi:hypothetical protein